eukprot:5974127-Ditylum_brightwellii.AAC.1
MQQYDLTIIYKDNDIAIMMTNANKSSGRTHHIYISYFALQGWVQQGDVTLAHIHGVANPANVLTKVLGWALHCRHVTGMVGHVGSKYINKSGRI